MSWRLENLTSPYHWSPILLPLAIRGETAVTAVTQSIAFGCSVFRQMCWHHLIVSLCLEVVPCSP